MSRIIDNFNFLKELNEQFKRNIKLFYACDDNKINVKNIIITNDDMVYTFGNEHNIEVFRSLDNEEVRNHFIIEKLCHQRVVDFRNNWTHLFARTFDGRLYCWDSYIANPQLKNPQLIKSLLNHNIIDIYCGLRQVIALTGNGIVFTSDLFGLYFEELNCNAFNGEKVKAISCGFTHCLALTESGCVYSWGRNPLKKSSFGAESCRKIPTLVILNNIIIDKISCGKFHTLLLSRDGDIYAFEMAEENDEFESTPIKINSLTDIRTKNEKTESSQTKSFRENKFIDIATHSLNDISIALSVNGVYYFWDDSEFQQPRETDFKSFDEIFAVKLRITAKAIHIQSDNNFIPNDKYINKFEEISQIGSGSYGKVFKVKLKSSSELFAIKKIAIKDENESLKELCTSLLISELNSDLIVRYHDVWYENDLVIENGFQKFTENSTLYIQMDLCEKTLEQIREEIGNDSILKLKILLTPLGFYITTKILIEILEAVEYLHKLNIIHRDLKPENILFSNGFNNRFVKIADFGLAKVHDKTKLNTENRGDVRYMAPEVVRSKTYDTKADIYSLGIIIQDLFEIDYDS
jgi:alpha-tubulin suppressor-like RCC1 family protein